MIKVVGSNSPSPVFTKNINKNTKKQDSAFSKFKKNYTDSFLKHSKETAPVLLGVTSLWATLDYGTRKIPITKAIKNNLLYFFFPVLILSSGILAGIDNNSKNNKTIA